MASNHDGYRFKSSLFAIEPGEDAEVNPGIYGRQLAVWLKDKLEERGHRIERVAAEDWGRCLLCANESFKLWIGVGSETEAGPAPPAEEVTWHCFAVAEVPLLKRLLGNEEAKAAQVKLDASLRGILEDEPKICLEPS